MLYLLVGSPLMDINKLRGGHTVHKRFLSTGINILRIRKLDMNTMMVL